MSVEAPLLKVRDLSVAFGSGDARRCAAREVSFEVMPGGTLGVVGESGCGKTMTLRSLIGLHDPAEVIGGEAMFRGRDLLGLSEKELMEVRGSEIAMVFQDPGSALNPLATVGSHLTEVLRVKRGMGRRAAAAEAVELLRRVGIAAPEQRIHDYPHQLSGGMRQRVMIALAISCGPSLLLADEPTTALDVTIQDQILTLLGDLRVANSMAVILISHDLGVVAQACDDVAVMYAGRVVEYGPVDEVLRAPRHPYTKALLTSVPSPDPLEARGELRTVAGQPPELGAIPDGCPFEPRCPQSEQRCCEASMLLRPGTPSHSSACLFPDKVNE